MADLEINKLLFTFRYMLEMTVYYVLDNYDRNIAKFVKFYYTTLQNYQNLFSFKSVLNLLRTIAQKLRFGLLLSLIIAVKASFKILLT